MDKTSKILQELQHLTQLVGSWKSQQEIPNIERELVLDKLKSIYDEVIFMDYVVVEDAPVEVVVAPVEAVVAPVPAFVAEPVVAEVPEPVSVPEPVVEPTLGAVTELEPAPEPVVESAPEPAPVAESEISRRRVNPEVIRSLYGDGAIVNSHTSAQSSAPAEAVAEPAVVEPAVAEPADVIAEPVVVSAVQAPSAPVTSAPAPSERLFPEAAAPAQRELPLVPSAPKSASQEHAKVRVLGESIGTAPAVNEVFAQQHPLHDVASKLRSSAVSQLQSSIGINDRFLLLRDLFAGDMGLYNQTISTLDRCADLDDALIYIQENFDWKPDTEAVNFLIDLLERKFEA